MALSNDCSQRTPCSRLPMQVTALLLLLLLLLVVVTMN
jgi:hypothetical protein